MSLTSSESHLNFPDNWFYFKDIYSCFVPAPSPRALFSKSAANNVLWGALVWRSRPRVGEEIRKWLVSIHIIIIWCEVSPTTLSFIMIMFNLFNAYLITLNNDTAHLTCSRGRALTRGLRPAGASYRPSGPSWTCRSTRSSCSGPAQRTSSSE